MAVFGIIGIGTQDAVTLSVQPQAQPIAIAPPIHREDRVVPEAIGDIPGRDMLQITPRASRLDSVESPQLSFFDLEAEAAPLRVAEEGLPLTAHFGPKPDLDAEIIGLDIGK